MMLGARRLQGPQWVQGKALVRDRQPPEASGFKLFWKTHDPFQNSTNACCKLQITVLKYWCGCPKKERAIIHCDKYRSTPNSLFVYLKTMEEYCDTFSICTYIEKRALL